MALNEGTLKLAEEALGPDHPDTLMVRNNLADDYRERGRLAEAIALFEAVLPARERVLGPDHPDTLTTRDQLADAYEAAGAYAKLEPLTRASLDQARKQFGATHWRTAGVMAWRGLCLVQLEKWPEAESVLRMCLSIREAAEPDDWKTFNTRSLLGEAVLGQSRYAEAEPLLVSGYEGIKARESTIPESHRTRRVAEAAERVLHLYRAWDKPATLDAWKVKLGHAELPSDVFARP
jgi:tetratricopeptide (TPR) repeat protein